MPTTIAKPPSPSQDKRWKIVDATMRRVGQHSRGLIETLHTVQEEQNLCQGCSIGLRR